MSFIDGDFRDYASDKKLGMMHDRFANYDCEECGKYPCICKKDNNDFCPECHSKPCSCDDNI